MLSMLSRKISMEGAYRLTERKEGEKIPIISDCMFHTMINNENRKKYGAYIIALSLEMEYEKVYESLIFVNNKLTKERNVESSRTVDFVCKIDEEIIGIEMNNNGNKDALERNISYAADLYKSKMIRGESYNYQKVIQININNFTFEGNREIIEKYSIKNEKGEELSEKIKFIHIYLPNIRKKYYNREKLSDLERLLLVLNDNREISQELARGDRIMEEYIKEAEEASSDEEIIGLYDKELHLEKLKLSEIRDAKKEAAKEGREEGIKEGIKEGEKNQSILIAKNMLDMGLDNEIVSECTGLSLEEVNDLKDN